MTACNENAHLGDGGPGSEDGSIEYGSAFEDRAGNGEEAIGDRPESSAVTMAACPKSKIFGTASLVALHGDASPMVDSIAQANVSGPSHQDEPALA